jgi:hypothetical protein
MGFLSSLKNGNTNPGRVSKKRSFPAPEESD